MIRTITLVGAIAFATPAAADWQYTKWGMSPQETLKASKGTAKELSPAEAAGKRIAAMGWEAKYEFPYTAGEYDFTGVFYFKNNKLSAVTLNLNDATKSAQLLQTLMGQYGKPIEKQNDMLGSPRMWRDEKNNNLVEYSSFGRFVKVIYSAAGRGASGL